MSFLYSQVNFLVDGIILLWISVIYLVALLQITKPLLWNRNNWTSEELLQHLLIIIPEGNNQNQNNIIARMYLKLYCSANLHTIAL